LKYSEVNKLFQNLQTDFVFMKSFSRKHNTSFFLKNLSNITACSNFIVHNNLMVKFSMSIYIITPVQEHVTPESFRLYNCYLKAWCTLSWRNWKILL